MEERCFSAAFNVPYWQEPGFSPDALPFLSGYTSCESALVNAETSPANDRAMKRRYLCQLKARFRNGLCQGSTSVVRISDLLLIRRTNFRPRGAPRFYLLFRYRRVGQLILVDHSALHHESYILQNRYVLHRIARYSDDVGILPHLNRANVF